MRKTIRLRGKLKGLFFLFKSHFFTPGKIFHFFAMMSALSRWISKHKSCEYNDYYSWKFAYDKREDLHQHLISRCKLNGPIDYLEFGVSTGRSFRWWLNHIDNKDARFYGFDTFTGLPEDWGPFKAGDMSSGDAPPQIDDTRHTFYQGLFQQTLMPFLKEYSSNRRKVIHMDADIYSATLYVLTTITPYLRPGDIIMFDEFNVPMHEFKAFSEWVSAFYIEYNVLGGVNNFYQMALELK